jgi:hypothetical protein
MPRRSQQIGGRFAAFAEGIMAAETAYWINLPLGNPRAGTAGIRIRFLRELSGCYSRRWQPLGQKNEGSTIAPLTGILFCLALPSYPARDRNYDLATDFTSEFLGMSYALPPSHPFLTTAEITDDGGRGLRGCGVTAQVLIHVDAVVVYRGHSLQKRLRCRSANSC